MNDNELIVCAVGDICPGEHYFSLGHGVRSHFRNNSLQDSFTALTAEFANADIVCGNLEGVISCRSKHENIVESQVFRGDPEFAQWLKSLGFSHMSIANNHFLQHGVEAALDSIEALERAGIVPIGRRDPTNNRLCIPEYVSVKSKRVGILAYSLVTERYEPGQSIYAEASNWQAIASDICALKQEVDCVIVSLHGGDEGLLHPNNEMVALCDHVCKAGAKIIFGHHSHTFQGVKKTDEAIVFYSLGNFIFDMDWDKRFSKTGIAKVIYNTASAALSYSVSPYEYYKSRLHKTKSTLTGPDDSHVLDYPGELAKFDRENQFNKTSYFLKNMYRGNFRLKTQFILSKIKRALAF